MPPGRRKKPVSHRSKDSRRIHCARCVGRLDERQEEDRRNPAGQASASIKRQRNLVMHECADCERTSPGWQRVKRDWRLLQSVHNAHRTCSYSQLPNPYQFPRFRLAYDSFSTQLNPSGRISQPADGVQGQGSEGMSPIDPAQEVLYRLPETIRISGHSRSSICFQRSRVKLPPARLGGESAA